MPSTSIQHGIHVCNDIPALVLARDVSIQAPQSKERNECALQIWHGWYEGEGAALRACAQHSTWIQHSPTLPILLPVSFVLIAAK